MARRATVRRRPRSPKASRFCTCLPKRLDGLRRRLADARLKGQTHLVELYTIRIKGVAKMLRSYCSTSQP